MKSKRLVEKLSHPVAGHQPVLPSYTALNPCALTAKSVVNHKASIDPLLTIGDGSMNPDNLERKDKKNILICDLQAEDGCREDW